MVDGEVVNAEEWDGETGENKILSHQESDVVSAANQYYPYF